MITLSISARGPVSFKMLPNDLRVLNIEIIILLKVKERKRVHSKTYTIKTNS